MRIVWLVLVLVFLGSSAPLAAQRSWGVALEVAQVNFGGHARSTAMTPETWGHPSSTRTWGLRVDRAGSRVGLSLGILLGSSGVEFENDEAAAEARNVLDLLEIAPEISIVVLKPREAVIRVHGGAVLDRWSPEGDNARTSVGGLGALSIALPLSSRVSVQVRWQMTLTESVFDDNDLPPDFSRESGWSERYVFGIRYGL